MNLPAGAARRPGDTRGMGARIRRNVGFKLLGTVVEKGLRLLLVVLATRALGAELWGQWTYALAWALLLVQITDLGLALFVAREVARAGPAPQLVGSVLRLKLMLATGYAVLMAVVAWLHIDEPVLAGALLVAAGVALTTSFVEAAQHVFRGVQDLRDEARVAALWALAQVSLGALALLWAAGGVTPLLAMVGAGDPAAQTAHATRVDALLAYGAALLVSAAVGLALAGRRVLQLVRAYRPTTPGVGAFAGGVAALLPRFRREVLPLGIAIVASLIYYKVDVPMIRALRGDVETGLYTAGYRVLENLAIVPATLMAAAFPALAETVSHAPQRAIRLHRTTLAVLGAAGVSACAVMMLVPELIVGLLYGEGFAGSARVLFALGPCALLTFINYLQTHMLVALGEVRAQMVISLSLIGVNVAANALLIPRFGGAGAAWATALTELGLLAACTPFVHRGLQRALAEAEAA